MRNSSWPKRRTSLIDAARMPSDELALTLLANPDCGETHSFVEMCRRRAKNPSVVDKMLIPSLYLHDKAAGLDTAVYRAWPDAMEER